MQISDQGENKEKKLKKTEGIRLYEKRTSFISLYFSLFKYSKAFQKMMVSIFIMSSLLLCCSAGLLQENKPFLLLFFLFLLLFFLFAFVACFERATVLLIVHVSDTGMF